MWTAISKPHLEIGFLLRLPSPRNQLFKKKLFNIGFIFLYKPKTTATKEKAPKNEKWVPIFTSSTQNNPMKLMFDAVKHPAQHGFIIMYNEWKRDSCRVPAEYNWHTKRNSVRQCDKALFLSHSGRQTYSTMTTTKKNKNLMTSRAITHIQKEPFPLR